jgi:predicted nuclease with TOPRIM domain
MSFEDNIKKWVLLDNQVKQLNDKSKELKEQKNSVESVILNYIDTNKLNNATAKITGGSLKFVESKQTSPITLKFLNQCLLECIKNESQVEYILNYIKEKREIKYTKDIKRYFEKE